MAAHPPPSREEIAKREIGVTGVSPAQARTLVLVFLAVLWTVPTLQWILDWTGEEAFPEPGWSDVVDAFRWGALPESAPDRERGPPADIGVLRRVKVANDQMLVNIHRLEDRQKERSFLTRNLVTPFQALTTRTIGLGNEKGYPGRDGWAYFRVGVDALTGPGFLTPSQLERRAASGSEWVPAPEPDPRPAILEFHRYLAGRGIDLVLVPVPVKPGIHPEHLSPRYPADAAPVRNPSFEAWKGGLTEAGVTVIDPAPLLVAGKAREPQYLETDTHWTPAAMEAVAAQIADALGMDAGPGDYRRLSRGVSSLGDVAANLLKLKGTDVYPPQEVLTHPVVTSDGEPWAAEPEAEVLLLGDSFANIYSSARMEWGTGAGLSEQLSYLLQQPLDVIAENDAGAVSTRLALAKALHRGDRLAGKRVVIWEFADRELVVGDWRRIDWVPIEIPDEAPTPVSTSPGTAIDGTIAAISRSPRPGTVTYKDCIVQIHLVDVEGLDGITELVLNLWGMRDNELTASQRFAAGDRRAFEVMDWDRAEAERGLAGAMRRELDDPDFELIMLPLYWADLETP